MIVEIETSEYAFRFIGQICFFGGLFIESEDAQQSGNLISFVVLTLSWVTRFSKSWFEIGEGNYFLESFI